MSYKSELAKPIVIRACQEATDYIAAARRDGRRIGLVPTMGALHAGHLSLVDASRRECDLSVVTIFVNPKQFGTHEDLDCYPRNLDTDLRQLRLRHVDLVFVPDEHQIYPPGYSTMVQPPRVSEPLEGSARPGHFQGVVTIVLKLFHIVPADFAYFGEKDFQQCRVISDMVTDLNLPIKIRTCPIVRDPDGLAISSRNAYLDKDQRQRALGLSRGLDVAERLFRAGQRDAKIIRDQVTKALNDAGVDRIDYVAVSDPTTLEELDRIDSAAVVLVAGHVGKTRLIDNRRLG